MKIQLDAQELHALVSGNEDVCASLTRIQKIKMVRLITGCGLKRASEFLQDLEAKGQVNYGVPTQLCAAARRT